MNTQPDPNSPFKSSVKSLVDRAAELMGTDPEGGSQLAWDALREAKTVDCLPEAIEAWRLLGFAKIAKADYEGALELFLDASEDLAARFGVERKPAAILNGIGSAYHHLGFYSTAISYLEEAKSCLEPNATPRSRSSTLNNLGLVYYLFGNLDAARAELTLALAESEAGGCEECSLSVRGNLAALMQAQGYHDEALAEFDKILTAAQARSASSIVATALTGMAQCLAHRGDFNGALARCERAISLYKGMGADRDLAEALRVNAEIQLKAGSPEQAYEIARVAMASPGAKAAGVKAPLLNIQARALEALGQWQEACAAWRDFVENDPQAALSKGYIEAMDKSLDRQRIAAAALESQLRRKAEDISRAQETIIEVLAGAAEAKDDITGQHIWRSARFVGALAATLIDMGLPGLDRAKAELYSSTARLHDIGKLGVADAVLQKPGPLDGKEWDSVKQHPLIGERIIERAAWREIGADYAQAALEIVGAHHERWDGSGYPRGLKGEEIPLGGRIMSLADVYDAMRSKRPYKEACSHEEAKAFIVSQCGRQFDPRVCAAFMACETEFERIYGVK